MASDDPNKTIDQLLDLSPQFGQIVNLPARNQSMAERIKKLEEPYLSIDDSENPGHKIVVGKRCATHVLSVFRAINPEDLHDFIDTVMFKKPSEVIVSDAVVNGVHPANVKRVMRELDYKRNSETWDQCIHDIVDLCVEVRGDKCVFNEAHIMKHLDPIERNTVSRETRKITTSTARPLLGYKP